MFLGRLAFVVGLTELTAPRRVVDVWMGLATAGDVELRPWVYTVARADD